MTTTDPTTDQEAAIEAVLGQLVTELGATLGVLLTSLGTRSGIWTALDGAGPMTSAEVAARVRVAPVLVREWLRAQAAGGYLTYDPATDSFTLPDATAAAVVHGPGGPMVEACISMLCSMAEGYEDFSRAFSTGQGYGWHQRTADHFHGVDALTQVAVPPELISAALGLLPDIATALDAGGSVVDVGCGYGSPTRAIARSHPQARVLGTDFHDISIMHAREATRAEGLVNLRFEVIAAADLAERGVDLITFFDSLHDLGDPRAALVAARAALSPTGAAVLFEPQAGDEVAENLHPVGRMYYAISTLACTPNAVSQRTSTAGEPIGAQAGERVLRELATAAGFGMVRRLDVPAPLNLVLELRP
ncbi:MAG: class I SAM-dependent methyltransferase [Microlunatus sp.]